MTDRLTCTVQNRIADVRLNRPEKMNALDDAMFAALFDVITELRGRDDVSVVVLSGNGRAFCSGLDLDAIRAMAGGRAFRPADADAVRGSGWSAAEHAMSRGQRVSLGWRGLPVPVITALHGVALGGGLQIALGADILLATPETKLGLIEMRWGFTPDMSGTQLLPRLVGRGAAAEMIYAARQIDGVRAERIGLVTRLAADPRAEALELAREMARLNPEALRMCKRLLDVAETGPLADGLALERESMRTIVGSPAQKDVAAATLAALKK
jgi:enoyl-CoA hydratase/carnithine racemase